MSRSVGERLTSKASNKLDDIDKNRYGSGYGGITMVTNLKPLAGGGCAAGFPWGKPGDRPACPRGAKSAPWDRQVSPLALPGGDGDYEAECGVGIGERRDLGIFEAGGSVPSLRLHAAQKARLGT